MIKVPKQCLECGAEWIGGWNFPGEDTTPEGSRTFYSCGANMSVKRGDTEGVYHILFKNCSTSRHVTIIKGEVSDDRIPQKASIRRRHH